MAHELMNLQVESMDRSEPINIQSADIFSAGLTLLSIHWGISMPKEGIAWNLIREGTEGIQKFIQFWESQNQNHGKLDFQSKIIEIALECCHPIPNQRPSAIQIKQKIQKLSRKNEIISN